MKKYFYLLLTIFIMVGTNSIFAKSLNQSISITTHANKAPLPVPSPIDTLFSILYADLFGNDIQNILGMNINPQLDDIQKSINEVLLKENEILGVIEEFYSAFAKNTYFTNETIFSKIQADINQKLNFAYQIVPALENIDDFSSQMVIPFNTVNVNQLEGLLSLDNLEFMEDNAITLSGIQVSKERKLGFRDDSLKNYFFSFYDLLIRNPGFYPTNDTNSDTIQQLTNINQDPYLNKVSEKDLSKYNIFANKIYYDRSIDLTAAQVGVLLLKIYKYEAFAIYTHYKASQYQTLCPASVPCTGSYEDAIQNLNGLFTARMKNVVLISKEAKNYYDLNLYIKGNWFQTLYNRPITENLNDFVHNVTILDVNDSGLIIRNQLYSNSLFLRVDKAGIPDKDGHIKLKTFFTNIRACKDRTYSFTNNSFQCSNIVSDNFDDSFVNYDGGGKDNSDLSIGFNFDNSIQNFYQKFNILSNLSNYPLSINNKVIAFTSKNARYAYLLSYNNNMFYISNSDGKIFNNINVGCIKYDYNCLSEPFEDKNSSALKGVRIAFTLNNTAFKWVNVSYPDLGNYFTLDQ